MLELRKETDKLYCYMSRSDTISVCLESDGELCITAVDTLVDTQNLYFVRNKERAQTFIDQLQELVNQMPDEGQSND